MNSWDHTAMVPSGDFTITGDCLFSDVDGLVLNGRGRRYSLRIGHEHLRPGGFWSVTMYDAESMGLIENTIDRHAIHSHMTRQMIRDNDGGMTLWLQADSPGADRESNWLPAPEGPFCVVMRVFLPVPEYLSPEWTTPTVRRR